MSDDLLNANGDEEQEHLVRRSLSAAGTSSYVSGAAQTGASNTSIAYLPQLITRLSLTGTAEAEANNAVSPFEPSPAHCTRLMKSLWTLKRNGVLCDVTLVAEGKRFPCHKVILVSCSDYFRSMFTSGMKETMQTEIELKGVTAKGLEKCIEVIYTSETRLEGDDMLDLIAAATHLQIEPAVEYAERNFLSGISTANFPDFISTAKLYNLETVLKQIDVFVASSLKNIREDGMLNLLSVEQVRSAMLECTLTEIELFEIIVDWLNSDATRDEQSEVLLSEIRYELIQPHDLVAKVQRVRAVMSRIRLRELVLEALNYHVIPYSQPTHYFGDATMRLRCWKERLVFVGGREIAPHTSLSDELLVVPQCFSTDSTSYMIRERCAKLPFTYRSFGQQASRTRFDDSAQTDTVSKTSEADSAGCSYVQRSASAISQSDLTARRLLTTMPQAVSHAQIVVFNNFLFVLGGCTTQCAHGESATSVVHRYDVRFDSWYPCTSMTYRRAYFYGGRLGDRIVVVGGRRKEGSLTHCEAYSPATNTWSPIAPLRTAVHAHAGCVVHDQLYIAGGYSNENFFADLLVYDARSDQWTELAPMFTARGWHCMVALHAERFRDESKASQNQNASDQVRFGVDSTEQIRSRTPADSSRPQSNASTDRAGPSWSDRSGAGLASVKSGRDRGGQAGTEPTHTDRSNNSGPERNVPLAKVSDRADSAPSSPSAVILVIGGSSLNANGQAYALFQCEQYDIASNAWSLSAPCPYAHKEASAVLHDDAVYVVGGYNLQSKCGQKVVSRYDPRTSIWTAIGSLPQALTGIGLARLKIPAFSFANIDV